MELKAWESVSQSPIGLGQSSNQTTRTDDLVRRLCRCDELLDSSLQRGVFVISRNVTFIIGPRGNVSRFDADVRLNSITADRTSAW